MPLKGTRFKIGQCFSTVKSHRTNAPGVANYLTIDTNKSTKKLARNTFRSKGASSKISLEINKNSKVIKMSELQKYLDHKLNTISSVKIKDTSKTISPAAYGSNN